MTARRYGQRGQETLQAILVVGFVLLPVMASIITFGTLVHTYIGTQAAAAAGARAAGTNGGFGPNELQQVQSELLGNHIDPTACVIIASAASVPLGQPISVTVDCPQHVGIPLLFATDVTLSSTYVSRGEVNQ